MARGAGGEGGTLVQRSTDGAAVSGRVRPKSGVLAGGSDAATVAVEDSTDGGGTDVLTLKSPANDSRAWVSSDPDGVIFETGVHVDVTGTDPTVTVEYEPA